MSQKSSKFPFKARENLLPSTTLGWLFAVYIDIKLKIRAACPYTTRADIKALHKVDGKFFGKIGTHLENFFGSSCLSSRLIKRCGNKFVFGDSRIALFLLISSTLSAYDVWEQSEKADRD
jgi:hypothetical protein